MKDETRRQLTVFAVLLAVDALLIVAVYLLFPLQQMAPTPEAAAQTPAYPAWVFGLANAGIVLVAYGLLGLAGYRLARGLGLPGIFKEGAGRREWAVTPMLVGFGVGTAISLVDLAFSALTPGWEGFSHPGFPASIFAAATAGIGEEILFRLFVMSLWALLLNLVLRRYGATGAALWLGNGLAALAFGAAHLPAAMVLVGASSPSGIPGMVLAELFVINGVIGVASGWQLMRTGLVAAAGVHFWGDVVWHVLWPAVRSIS